LARLAEQLAEENQNRLIVEARENVGAFTADAVTLKIRVDAEHAASKGSVWAPRNASFPLLQS
jgi:hypothetical protein